MCRYQRPVDAILCDYKQGESASVLFLTRSRTIVWSGLAFLGLTLAFGLWVQAYDLLVINEVSDPDQIRAIVTAMT